MEKEETIFYITLLEDSHSNIIRGSSSNSDGDKVKWKDNDSILLILLDSVFPLHL